MTDDDFRVSQHRRRKVSFDYPVKRHRATDQLRAIVRAENVLTDDYSRLCGLREDDHDLIHLREKKIENLPDAVVRPRSKEDVQALVRFCHAEKYRSPFSAGSVMELVAKGIS